MYEMEIEIHDMPVNEKSVQKLKSLFPDDSVYVASWSEKPYIGINVCAESQIDAHNHVRYINKMLENKN